MNPDNPLLVPSNFIVLCLGRKSRPGLQHSGNNRVFQLRLEEARTISRRTVTKTFYHVCWECWLRKGMTAFSRLALIFVFCTLQHHFSY